MNLEHPVIGVDLTGGDLPPDELFESLFFSERQFSKKPRLVFFAPESLLHRFRMIVSNDPHHAFEPVFIETKQIITMEDDPLYALRHKKDAATPLALMMLAKQALGAFVSIGNTGALIGGSKFYLNTLDGIKRPGLLALLPTKKRPLAVIDIGANLACSARHLVEFAMMGIAYQKCVGITSPKIGLLNIGSEKMKGTTALREAYELLQKLNTPSLPPVFVGNIEGKEAFQGIIDVLVTDGFSGNIFLKTAEGMSSFILDKMMENPSDEHSRNTMTQLAKSLDFAEYPGALICGVDGIVIKCHGYSNAGAIHSGIQGAIDLIETQFVEKLKSQLKKNFM